MGLFYFFGIYTLEKEKNITQDEWLILFLLFDLPFCRLNSWHLSLRCLHLQNHIPTVCMISGFCCRCCYICVYCFLFSFYFHSFRSVIGMDRISGT